ncbi:MAG: PSD1 domain-containing protein [Candidatus Hydrogenedentes bacterium]|nr:PSD1 domain-containing protein [Candidatus Hydrogenedentota bacterium]
MPSAALRVLTFRATPWDDDRMKASVWLHTRALVLCLSAGAACLGSALPAVAQTVTPESVADLLERLTGDEASRATLLHALEERAKRDAASAAHTVADGPLSFNRDIRPILSNACFTCHGPDSGKRKAGLRLDTEEGAFATLSSGHAAIVPGKRADSALFQRITTSDTGDLMPPPESHKSLTAAQIVILGRWIDEGAKYERHWAFVKPIPQTLPGVADAQWPRNDVDRFILAKLETAGIAPNPEADRRTLIRRAYFDLIGLPPAPEEVDAFVNDPDPNAYDKLVDALLESPHYGERWARHWLDLARFAESHGYEQDYNREFAYHYRDFVIKAFNQDLPYDTFVKWQIAGDEYAPGDPLAMMATGFLGAGTHATQITKSQVEKERYDELDDMARTVGTAMLGLTVGCARCHDHKYDPIPMSDYYRFISTFTKTVRSNMDIPVDDVTHQQALARFEQEHAPLVTELESFEKGTLAEHFNAWLASEDKRDFEAPWHVLHVENATSAGGAYFTKLDDGSLRAQGVNPASDTYTFTARTDLAGITAIRIEAVHDEGQVAGGPGRATNGNFALSSIKVLAAPANGEGEAVEAKLIRPIATFEQTGLPIAAALDDDPKSGWAVDPEFGKDHAAIFRIETPAGFAGGTILTVTLTFDVNTGHGIARPRLSVSNLPWAVGFDSERQHRAAQEALTRIKGDPATLTDADRDVLFAWYRTTDGDWRDRAKKLREHEALRPKPGQAQVMVCSEGLPAIRTHTQGGDYLENTHFLKRGDPNQKGDIATQGFLTALQFAADGEGHWKVNPPEGSRTPYLRTSLAEWLTDCDNGAGFLLARVIVNRLWQHHMGRGIVATPSDFGLQGEPPTHPELLDWLAIELVNNGWRLKPIHRIIMTSATYRQSAAIDEAKMAADNQNKLCWHHPRKRLEAEIIRDAMLSASGTLDPTPFGPGTLEPHQRRSIYFFVKRSKLIPMMTLFDAPDATQGMGERPATTIAPQALLMMNNALVRQCASSLAQRVCPQQAVAPDEAVRAAYRLCVGRAPDDVELTDALAFLKEQEQSYLTEGNQDAGGAALADFCQILLSLNEFVYVD